MLIFIIMRKGFLYTIGYAGYSLEGFLETLKSEHITAVVDTRAEPGRSHFREYRANSIRASISGAGLLYRFFGDSLGARPADKKLYTDGRADFAKIMADGSFRKTCAHIGAGLEAGHNICLMCAQKDPIICHRAILIAHYMRLASPGIRIVHLHPAGAQSQEQLDARVLRLRAGNDYRMSLLRGPKERESDIMAAYEWQGRQIAYELPEDDS